MKIKIDGAEYELLDIGTVDLDESCWFYDLAGAGPEALEEMEEFNPKLVRGLLCLSIARAKPEVRRSEIEEAVGKLKITDLGEAFEQGVADSPPAPDPAPETESELPSSGDASKDAGDGFPDESGQNDSGTRDSDTGRDSARAISAA